MADAPTRDPEAEERSRRTFARIKQLVDYAFFLVYGLIVVEILLELGGARESNAFKDFMDGISSPFLGPFEGLFGPFEGLFRDRSMGVHRVMYSYIAALVVWILVHLAVRGLLRVLGPRAAQDSPG